MDQLDTTVTIVAAPSVRAVLVLPRRQDRQAVRLDPIGITLMAIAALLLAALVGVTFLLVFLLPEQRRPGRR